MSTVGENIFMLRKKLGWTQEELANMMGYKSKSTINKIEMGINDIPQSKIAQFAEVLGTTPAHLMGWKEENKALSEEPKLSEGEKALLDLFNRVPEDKQQMVLQMIRAALGNQE
jgi:transcriptional regulator with XRE-family HTH domain